MISKEKVNEYRHNGYIILRDFFDKEEISKLRQEVKELFALEIKSILNFEVDIENERVFEKSMYRLFLENIEVFINCGKQAQQLINLHKIGADPNLIDILKNLGLEFPIISVRPSMLFNSRHLAKKEEYWKLGAHQDWRSSQGSLDAVTVWFPLIKSNAEIGALQVIPKSHKLGLLDSEAVSYYGKLINDFDEKDYQQLEFEIGDVLIFSSFLIHKSGVNTTQSIRWSVQLRYNNLKEKTFIERGFPNPFIYKPQSELITPGFPQKEQVLEIFTEQ